MKGDFSLRGIGGEVGGFGIDPKGHDHVLSQELGSE
jgi:hypothetical protein